jgi:hypothetical protein
MNSFRTIFKTQLFFKASRRRILEFELLNLSTNQPNNNRQEGKTMKSKETKTVNYTLLRDGAIGKSSMTLTIDSGSFLNPDKRVHSAVYDLFSMNIEVNGQWWL